MTATLQLMLSQLAWVVCYETATINDKDSCTNPINILTPLSFLVGIKKKDELSYYNLLQTVKIEMLAMDKSPEM